MSIRVLARYTNGMTRTTKVRITFTLEIDQDAWSTEFGTGTGALDTNRDVKAYFSPHELTPEHLRYAVTIMDT